MDRSISTKRELVSFLIKNKFVVTHNFIESLPDDSSSYDRFIKALNECKSKGKIDFKVFSESFQHYLSLFSKVDDASTITFSDNKNDINKSHSQEFELKLIKNFEITPSKKTVSDFVNHFKSRLDKIKPFILSHKELSSPVSIKKISPKAKEVSLIGLVYELNETRNGHIKINLEDDTGMISCFISKNNQEIFDSAKNELVLDEIIGIRGVYKKGVIFATHLIFPDIPNTNELKKLDEEVYAVVFSDFHVGSSFFLEDSFNKFLDWINGKLGNYEQKKIALKTRFLFIAGDIVAGVGIYPNQESELNINDIDNQYKAFFDLMKKIPKYIKIIITPGNHDAMRLSEPQPPIPKRFAKDLEDFDNIMFVSNPAYLEITSKRSHNSLNVLLYHGYSFDHYIANIPMLRFNGGYDATDELMKLLLKKRHLAPTHTSSLYIPGNDHLVIDIIPDIFITGHVHKYKSAMYKNITLINGSCWEAKTSFQEKVGHEPEPSRVAVVNLNTRKVKTINFQ